MSIRIREMSYHKVKINKILSRITGKPEEQVRYQIDPLSSKYLISLLSNMMHIFNPLFYLNLQIDLDTDRDNFMNPWEAKEYGLIDGVIDDGKPGLIAPIADASPPPKTRIWDQWKVEGGRKVKKNLPSEHKFLDKGNGKEGETPVAV